MAYFGQLQEAACMDNREELMEAIHKKWRKRYLVLTLALIAVPWLGVLCSAVTPKDAVGVTLPICIFMAGIQAVSELRFALLKQELRKK